MARRTGRSALPGDRCPEQAERQGECDERETSTQYPAALWALIGCALRTGRLLTGHRLHLPDAHIGLRLRFADGSTGRVYRETVAEHGPVRAPCVLVVEFRLRGVRGWGHAAFRWESLLNTPLFAGFPGFVSKLWLAADERGRYRGLYQWDGAGRADHYARALWRVLALVSVPGSIHYIVLPWGCTATTCWPGRNCWTGRWRPPGRPARRPGGGSPEWPDRPELAGKIGQRMPNLTFPPHY